MYYITLPYNAFLVEYANSIIHSPKFFRDESPSSNKEEQCSNIIMNESIINDIAQSNSKTTL